jgi:hypothetical protein
MGNHSPRPVDRPLQLLVGRTYKDQQGRFVPLPDLRLQANMCESAKQLLELCDRVRLVWGAGG